VRGETAPAVEELLRCNGPLETATKRYTREDTTVAGLPYLAESWFSRCSRLPNRDEQQFEDGDRLDLGREPNAHLALEGLF
jgi:cytochrome P450